MTSFSVAAVGAAVSLALYGAPVSVDLGPALGQAFNPPAPIGRPVTPLDLLTLRDVDGESVRISPDGRWVVYQVHQAVLETNDYRTTWYVISTTPGSTPVEIGDGGDARWRHVGEWLVTPPQWSPDSRWVVYSALRHGELQLWRSSRDGHVREQLTHNSADVRRFAWSHNGRSVLFTVGRTRAAERQAGARSAAGGVVLEDRYNIWAGEPRFDVPSWQQQDVVTFGGTPPPAEEWIVDVATPGASHQERRATEREAAAFRGLDVSEMPRPLRSNRIDNMLAARARLSPDGSTIAYARYAPNPRHQPLSTFAIYTIPVAGADTVPTQRTPSRSFVEDVWWSPDGRQIYFTGYADDGMHTGMFVIPAGGTASNTVTREVAHTADDLEACSVDTAASRAACVRQNATSPPEVAVVDLASGSVHTLTDLNPQFRTLRVSHPTRLSWVNQYGDTTWGQFLKPLDYVPGQRYPLVITMYRARGFLRGNVGDEYPIQSFAAHGFAVLAFDIGHTMHDAWPWSDSSQVPPFDSIKLAYYSPLAGLSLAVRQLVDSGFVDSTRVGLSGLSRGAFVTQFAITHSSLFRAAAVSGSSGVDPVHYYLNSDFNRGLLRELGLIGPPDGPRTGQWREVSTALNADRVIVPLLIQAAGSEFVGAIEFYQALRDRHKPVEMLIFPDEAHVKHQPQHRYAIYQRNLDWFDFWLRGVEDPDPTKRAQYTRWAALRHP